MTSKIYLYDNSIKPVLVEVKDKQKAMSYINNAEHLARIPSKTDIVLGDKNVRDTLKLINEFVTKNPKYQRHFIFVIGKPSDDGGMRYNAYVILRKAEFDPYDPAFLPPGHKKNRVVSNRASRRSKRIASRSKKQNRKGNRRFHTK